MAANGVLAAIVYTFSRSSCAISECDLDLHRHLDRGIEASAASRHTYSIRTRTEKSGRGGQKNVPGNLGPCLSGDRIGVVFFFFVKGGTFWLWRAAHIPLRQGTSLHGDAVRWRLETLLWQIILFCVKPHCSARTTSAWTTTFATWPSWRRPRLSGGRRTRSYGTTSKWGKHQEILECFCYVRLLFLIDRPGRLRRGTLPVRQCQGLGFPQD